MLKIKMNAEITNKFIGQHNFFKQQQQKKNKKKAKNNYKRALWITRLYFFDKKNLTQQKQNRTFIISSYLLHCSTN